jgi:hypothetical protein
MQRETVFKRKTKREQLPGRVMHLLPPGYQLQIKLPAARIHQGSSLLA